MKKSCPRKEGHSPSRVNYFQMSKKLYDLLTRANSARARSDLYNSARPDILCLSRIDRGDPSRQPKVLTWIKEGPARRVTLPSKKSYTSSRANFLFLM